MNRPGRPLTSHEVVVATIAATRTRAGLAESAKLDTGNYPLGISVTAAGLRALPTEAHAQHGEGNYTIAASGGDQAPTRSDERAQARVEGFSPAR